MAKNILLYHPKTNRSATVPEPYVKVHLQNGWEYADAPGGERTTPAENAPKKADGAGIDSEVVRMAKLDALGVSYPKKASGGKLKALLEKAEAEADAADAKALADADAEEPKDDKENGAE
ncbi:MAG: hypothetical protein FWF33_00510 [Clostridiales bacterium]|nr:hypothetical protein [Clostridiales bacterium]